MASIKANTTYTINLTQDELYIIKIALQSLSDGSFEDTLMSGEIDTLEQLNRLLRDTP